MKRRKLSEPLRCLAIQILLDATARGFGVRGERLPAFDAEEALREYAAFTRRCVEQMTVEADRKGADREAFQEAAGDRLYRAAFGLGERIRSVTRLTDPSDLQKLVFRLYRLLEIEMGGELPGEITVSACYFSRCYTPAVCRVMSRVDSGIIAGLYGGGELRFTERITEGCGRCRACFTGTGQE